MILRKLTYLLTVLSAVVTLCGCSGDEPLPGGGRHDADVYLQLSVATTEAGTPGSRADYPAGQYPDGYDYGFEGPAGDNEKIHTMRFIVVRPNGKVEHNILVNNTTADVKAATGRYKVNGNETKTIWLIGNEAALPTDYQQRLSGLMYGDKFPTDADLNYTLSRADADTPLFPADGLIPMTEFHEIEVGGAQYDDATGDPIPYEYNLFVTRAAVKFTFTATVAATYTEKALSTITINEIADKEYLFPTGTTYDPVKANNFTNRIITKYSVPEDATTSPYTVNWVKSSDNSNTYTAQAAYLPETAFGTGTKEYSITMPINDVEFTATLTNLPSLPRNTHVKVDLLIKDAGMTCTVTVVPYTGVYLNPNFGIDRD